MGQLGVAGDEVARCIAFLAVEAVIYLILTRHAIAKKFNVRSYLKKVLKSEYGVRLPWHFPITQSYRWVKRTYRRHIGNTTDVRPVASDTTAIDIPSFVNELVGEDDDVKAERERVLKNHNTLECPVNMVW
jgi:hypothetical protein